MEDTMIHILNVIVITIILTITIINITSILYHKYMDKRLNRKRNIMGGILDISEN